MLALDIASHWLTGTWYPPLPTTPAPIVRDIEGVITSVGDIVKIECIVESIEYLDNNNGILVLGVLYPYWSSSLGPPLPFSFGQYANPKNPLLLRVSSLSVKRN